MDYIEKLRRYVVDHMSISEVDIRDFVMIDGTVHVRLLNGRRIPVGLDVPTDSIPKVRLNKLQRLCQ